MKDMNAYKGIDQTSARSTKRSLRRKKLTPRALQYRNVPVKAGFMRIRG
jgi:hypothetical protein